MTATTHTSPSEKPSTGASILAWIGGGLALAATIALIAIAVWPQSEADKAYDDGVQVGNAVADVYYADSQAEAEDALADLDAAVADSADHASDYVGDQAADQQDALNRAVDGYVGSITADDDFEQSLYQDELDVAVDDLSSNAAAFQDEAPEVNAAFWDGVEAGLNAET